MKTYKTLSLQVIDEVTDTRTFIDQEIMINGRSYRLDHSYNAPYERNDLYLKLKAEKLPTASESLLHPDLGQTLYADVDHEYNYYAQEYERATRNHRPSIMPSLNNFLMHQAGISPDADMYHSAVTLGGKLEYREELLYSLDYFRDFGKTLDIITSPFPPLDEVGDHNQKSEFINKDMYRLFLDNENKREIFPFFAKVNLEGIPNSQLANILETYRLDTKFIEFLIMHANDNVSEVRYGVSTQADTDGAFEELVPESVAEPDQGIREQVRAYDLDGLYAHIDHGHEEAHMRSSRSEDQTTCNFFESYIMGQIGRTKIDEYIQNSENGKVSPIAYVIRKRPMFDPELSQTYYFFNYEEVARFLFFDTQVYYGELTEYKMSVINSIVCERSTTKSLIFLEEPYYKESIRLLDSPPIAPDVELITYRGVSNKVLILFNQMVDKRVEHPIYVNESDAETFSKQYSAQKVAPESPLMFESDDPTHFEIFKSLTKPSSYSEFANEHYRVVDSGGLTAASYKDTIVPNQTYYYMFRALDIHGFCSNPSPIYEFTLIKEGETLYPRTRIVELKPPSPPTQKSKSFKKYLKIGLSPRQYQIPSEITGMAGEHLVGTDIQIGTAEDLLVGSGRTFKFRIKSKNTGKLIDINVTFKKNKVIRA